MDTHVFRIARRLELAKGDTAQKVEQELMRVIPQRPVDRFSHQLIHHGRQVCDGTEAQVRTVQLRAALPFDGQDVAVVTACHNWTLLGI